MELVYKSEVIKLSDSTGFYPPSGYLRAIYARLFAKRQEDRDKVALMQKVLVFLDGEPTEMNMLKAIVKAKKEEAINDDEVSQLSGAIMTAEEIIKDTNDTLSAFKESIDLDKIKDPKHKDLLEQSVESDFWQKQNLEVIEEKVKSFRVKFGL